MYSVAELSCNEAQDRQTVYDTMSYRESGVRCFAVIATEGIHFYRVLGDTGIELARKVGCQGSAGWSLLSTHWYGRRAAVLEKYRREIRFHERPGCYEIEVKGLGAL